MLMLCIYFGGKGEGRRDWLSIFKREKKEEIDKLIWRLVKEKVQLDEKLHFLLFTGDR